MLAINILTILACYGRVHSSDISGYQYQADTDCEKTNLHSEDADSPQDCVDYCNSNPHCFGFVYCTFFQDWCVDNCFYKRSDCRTTTDDDVKFYIKHITCNGGTRTRSTSCTNPAPRYGGNDCRGDSFENVDCNSNPCPVDGGWTSWSSWSACSVSCSEGISKRSRSCTNPSPQYGGDNCVGDGMEIIVCRLQYCPGIILKNKFKPGSGFSATSQSTRDRLRCAALCSATRNCTSFRFQGNGQCVIEDTVKEGYNKIP